MFKPVKVRQYLNVMKKKGFSAELVLAGSGVTEEMLATRNLLIDIDQSRTVVRNMIELTSDHGIGLEIGWQTQLFDLGLVGYAMMSAQSLRQTVQHWISFSNLLIGVPMRVHIEERTPDNWALVLNESAPLGFIYNFCVEEQLAMAYKLGCDLSATKPRPTKIELSYPAPLHYKRYSEYFDCPVSFGAGSTRIHFFAPRLDQPLVGDDPELNEFCENQCRIILQQMKRHSSITSEVNRMLSLSVNVVPTIEEVAQQLRISARTLRRNLQREGTSYQQLANQVRANCAKEYLRSFHSVKEVSYRLGFSEVNSFRRSFKLWTGQTVGNYVAAERQHCNN